MRLLPKKSIDVDLCDWPINDSVYLWRGELSRAINNAVWEYHQWQEYNESFHACLMSLECVPPYPRGRCQQTRETCALNRSRNIRPRSRFLLCRQRSTKSAVLFLVVIALRVIYHTAFQEQVSYIHQSRWTRFWCDEWLVAHWSPRDK